MSDPAPAAPVVDDFSDVKQLLIDQGSIDGEKTDSGNDDAAAVAMAEDSDMTPEEAAEAQTMAAEVEAPAPEPTEDGPSLSRGLAALARREAKVVERERGTAIVQKENADLKNMLARVKQMALEDPAGFYSQFVGISPEETPRIAAQMYYEAAGDAAPPEFKERKAVITLERRVQFMQNQLAQQQTQAQLANARQAALVALQGFARSVPEGLPYLRAEAEADPSQIAEVMLYKLGMLRDAGQLTGLSTEEEIAAKVAQEVNSDYEKYVKRISRVHLKNAQASGVSVAQPSSATKIPAPATGENKPVSPKSKSINKNATALTRPRVEPRTHDDDIAQVIEDLRAGRIQPS